MDVILLSLFVLTNWGTFKQGVSKQGVMTFAWRPGSQYDVAATRGADSPVLPIRPN